MSTRLRIWGSGVRISSGAPKVQYQRALPTHPGICHAEQNNLHGICMAERISNSMCRCMLTSELLRASQSRQIARTPRERSDFRHTLLRASIARRSDRQPCSRCYPRVPRRANVALGPTTSVRRLAWGQSRWNVRQPITELRTSTALEIRLLPSLRILFCPSKY